MNDMKIKNFEIRNPNGRSKGEFIIDSNGKMNPQTKNKTIWGSTPSSAIPLWILDNPNFVIPINDHTLVNGLPIRLSALFKFSKNNFSIFAENFGMELCACFNTKTTFNCPAKIDKDEPSIQEALSDLNIPQEKESGLIVFSMLGKDDYLYSLANASGKQEPTSDIKDNLQTIYNFAYKKLAHIIPKEKIEKNILQMQKEYCYQYLFRDCFGDVDFTSKNSGIIFNDITNKISLAPQFDFGEMLSILYTSKIVKPKLDSIENYPENIRPLLVDKIDAINAKKMEKFNASPEVLSQIDTFGNTSWDNVEFICKQFPDVAISFLHDLNKFNDAQMMPLAVNECCGDEQEQLLNEEEKDLVLRFTQGRMDYYAGFLYQNLIEQNQINDSFQQIEK